ncbi:MAG: NADH:flavin oxidoreductase/NADH oxidase [Ginsengibacter sp.]
MALLFEPLTIRQVTLKNRIVVSPMCEYSSTDGFANDWHLVHLGSRAVGGAGLVLAEATAVSPEGRITPNDLGLWKDDHIEFLKRITTFIEANGAVPGIQLAHAGRKASHDKPWTGGAALTNEKGAWQTLAPSPIAYKAGEPTPQAMTPDDISKLIADFEAAAKRAVQAGFKVIEIHAAHGYLINEFLSPVSNSRTDEYGGSFENRIRVLIEIVKTTRQAIGEESPLFVRISSTDWVEDGWNENDSIALARLLKTYGVDLIDCSSGGNSHEQKIPVGPMYQVKFAELIKENTGILTGAVGIITTAEEAENILKQNKADLIIMARQFLRDPYFPLHAARLLGQDVKWPGQYERAKL